jgi:hypothetical protein
LSDWHDADWYDELRDDCVDWEPETEYEFEDGSPAPDPDKTQGYEVVAEHEEAASWDDDGSVDGIARVVVVRKLPLPPAAPAPGCTTAPRRIRRAGHRPRARRSRPAKARSPSREDDDPHHSRPPSPAAQLEGDLEPPAFAWASVRSAMLALQRTPLQIALSAQDEVYAAVREHVSVDERRAFWSVNSTKLARETACDTDWDSERPS